MKSIFFALKVRSLNHIMPEADFWLGFVIYHSRKNPLGDMEPFVSALEITALGLTVDRRRNGEFYYPIEIRNANRANPQVMDQYLVEIRDINSAFAAYTPVYKVDFVIASKRNGTLTEIGGNGFLDIITSAGELSLEINGEKPALLCHIALADKSTLSLVPDIDFTPLQGWAFTGSMDDYVTHLNQHPGLWYTKSSGDDLTPPEPVSIVPEEPEIISDEPEVEIPRPNPAIISRQIVVSVLVVLVLAVCGYFVWAISGNTPHKPSAPLPRDVSLTEPPILSVGDTWVIEKSGAFQREDKLSQFTHAVEYVEHVDGSGYIVSTRNAAGRVMRSIKIDRSFDLVSSDDGVSNITYSPGLHYYDFPLYVGKKWHRQINKSRVDSQNPKSTERTSLSST